MILKYVYVGFLVAGFNLVALGGASGRSKIPSDDITLKTPSSLRLAGPAIPFFVDSNGGAVAKYYSINLESGAQKIDCEVYFSKSSLENFTAKHLKSKKQVSIQTPESEVDHGVAKMLWNYATSKDLQISKVELMMVPGDDREPKGLKPNYKISISGSDVVQGLACHRETKDQQLSRQSASEPALSWKPDDFISTKNFEKAFIQAGNNDSQ